MKQDTKRKLLAVAELWGLVGMFFGLAVGTCWISEVIGPRVFYTGMLVAFVVFVTVVIWRLEE